MLLDNRRRVPEPFEALGLRREDARLFRGADRQAQPYRDREAGDRDDRRPEDETDRSGGERELQWWGNAVVMSRVPGL